ncbi:hypothetical protein B0O99DRAFT_577702 [Bisporella sp. PMI_857]|nr:hypothetical protein B0O99DRAFT_577702 [Bisporella sp. PMI_857]
MAAGLTMLGDLKRPSCSACHEEDLECTYSYIKRRPGPARGSLRRTKDSSKAGTSSNGIDDACTSSTDFCTPEINFSVQDSVLEDTLIPVDPQHDDVALPLTPASLFWGTLSSSDSLNSHLTLEQRRELTQRFYENINPSFPLFREDTFFSQLENGIISDYLLSIIHAISARILGPVAWWSQDILDTSLAYLVNTVTVETWNPTEPLSLDNFRTSCLLTFYGFHQYPGEKAWTRIALLSRKAYQCGLHQIDSAENRDSFDWNLISDDRIEDWRHVWWCIFCLDSYSSFSNATPYSVEVESVKTALLGTSLHPDGNGSTGQKNLCFIPPDKAQLWNTVEELRRGPPEYYNFNLHMILTTFLKEAVTIFRLQKQNPSNTLQERMSSLGESLSAIRLALPRRHTEAARDVLGMESCAQYHARLLTIFKLHISRLLVCLPVGLPDDPQWQPRWQQNLEVCCSIVSTIQHWDPGYLFTVDPAVCFMVLPVLIILHLHSLNSGNSSQKSQEQLSRWKNILRLFLQQYAVSWALPRFLVASFDKFTCIMLGSLHAKDIHQTLSHFHGPLHQKWLKFLSLSLDTHDNQCQGTSVGYSSSRGETFAMTEMVNDSLYWI